MSTEMCLRQANRSQKAPGHAIKIVAVVAVLFVSIEQCLMIEIQDLEQKHCIGVHEFLGGVVDEELCFNFAVL